MSLVLEKKNNLPVGWEQIKLAEIAIINPPKPNDVSDDLDVSFIPMKCVEALTGQVDLNNIKKYHEVKKGFTSFLDDDIIFAKITPCMENGKIAIVHNLKNGIGFGSTEFHVIRMRDQEISGKLYFWYLVQDNFRNNAQREMKGTAGQLRVPSDYLKNVMVPLPPLNEQKRIAEKIEEFFSELNHTKTILENTFLQLKQYRQSLLSNLLQGLSLKHPSQKLNDLCTKITDGTHFTPEYTTDGIPFISVKDIRHEKIYFDNCKYVSKETHDNLIKRCHPEFGDLLITKSGTIGRMAIVDTKTPFSLFVSVALIKPIKNINRNYLKYIFHNFFNHIDISQDIKGGVIKNFHLEDIREVMIPMPSDDEQQEIVIELEQKFSLIHNTENIINSMLLQIDSLRSSILKQAFEGKLVPQDPNDEPAEILLQKIKQEKEQLIQKQKSSRSTKNVK